MKPSWFEIMLTIHMCIWMHGCVNVYQRIVIKYWSALIMQAVAWKVFLLIIVIWNWVLAHQSLNLYTYQYISILACGQYFRLSTISLSISRFLSISRPYLFSHLFTSIPVFTSHISLSLFTSLYLLCITTCLFTF